LLLLCANVIGDQPSAPGWADGLPQLLDNQPDCRQSSCMTVVTHLAVAAVRAHARVRDLGAMAEPWIYL